ncbi:hypothetical protein VT84_16510 [Gemmata sp. SH-PL17]|uniref:hypothetical protein n=1 Tax=Gemmata sp. SH-PL17 TaxID=1630693 RepID=UPI00078E75F1|nr:hypothetical protein [Gemmata sp. SH-PL17]AMV26003.1 hypothetical protein VT84_16510 [Gemmata sp. SH-PL17]
MERELWKAVYPGLQKVARRFEQRYVQIHSWRVAAVLLWGALHDRPVCWACDARNWTTTRLKPDRLPSPATVSRRAQKTSFALFFSALANELKGTGPPAWELIVDGKPLPVGKCFKDPDAKPSPCGLGYKLRALWGTKSMPDVWEVTAARENESAVAVRLLTPVRGTGFLYVDGSYEDNRVYDAAGASGYLLLANPGTQATGGTRVPEPVPVARPAPVRRRVRMEAIPAPHAHRARVR